MIGFVCHGIMLGWWYVAYMLRIGWMTLEDCLPTVVGYI